MGSLVDKLQIWADILIVSDGSCLFVIKFPLSDAMGSLSDRSIPP